MEIEYSKFTLEQLKDNFQLDIQVSKIFDESIPSQIPSEFLLSVLKSSEVLTLTSEKEKSEGIIFPVMIELKKLNLEKISIFSGRTLDADSDKGLSGECDFIISNKPNLFDVDVPIIALIEAKKDDTSNGIAQCIAQMMGSKLFNEKHNKIFPSIYGCVSTGYEWKFLKMEGHNVTIDSKIYFLPQLDRILGIFQYIIQQY
jgi:hypothetical protein